MAASCNKRNNEQDRISYDKLLLITCVTSSTEMNERCDNCSAPKRKTGLHITGARIHAKHIHRANHYFGKGRGISSSHFERPCGRGYNVHSGCTMSCKGNFFNRSSVLRDREVSPIPSQRILSTRIPTCTNSISSPKNDSAEEKPATFVCEGIEVDFDSSDSEEEVRALKVVKVLKKNASKSGCAIHICSTENDNRRSKLIPWVHGKVIHRHELPKKSQNGDEGQVSAPLTPAAVIIPQTSARPSYVILSGSRKRTTPNPTGAIGNCAIIKRPRFLFSQQVRPSTNQSTHPLLPFPRFVENAHFSPDNHSDLNSQELRVIEDVLDMMEEVEMRAQYSNMS